MQDDQPTIIVADPSLRRDFTQIPNRIIRRHDMPGGPKITYILLLSYAWDDGACFPGQDRLAKDAHVTGRAVRTYLKWLADNHYISVQRRGANRTNVYTLLPLPDGQETSTDPKHAAPEQKGQSEWKANGLGIIDGQEQSSADKDTDNMITVRSSDTGVSSLATRKRGRPLDDLAVALFRGVGENPEARRTQKEWVRFWTMHKQISGAEGTAEDVASRAANYRMRFPNASLTIPALANHWGECATGPPKEQTPQERVLAELQETQPIEATARLVEE